MLVALFWLFVLAVYLLVEFVGAWFVAWVLTLIIGLGGIVLTASQFWLLVGGLFLLGTVSKLFK
jgi:hypothetical protein